VAVQTLSMFRTMISTGNQYSTRSEVHPRRRKVRVTAIYDNSRATPESDPTKTVAGARTYDEMMIGYIEHFTPYAPSKVGSNSACGPERSRKRSRTEDRR